MADAFPYAPSRSEVSNSSSDEEERGSGPGQRSSFRSPDLDAEPESGEPSAPNLGRRRGARSQNLRGTRNMEGGRNEPGMTPSNVTFIQDYKIDMNKVPEDYAEYRGWRFTMRGGLLGIMNVDPLFVKRWLRSIDDAETVEELRDYPHADEASERFDAKMFSALTKAMNAKHQSTHLLNMESRIQESNGRQALKLLDKLHHYKHRVMKKRSTKSLLRRKCKDMDDLKDHCTSFRHGIFVLEAAKAPLADEIALEMLIESIEDVKGLEATISEWDTIDEEMQTTEKLLSRLENSATKYELRKEEKDREKKGKALTSQVTDELCPVCKKGKHPKEKCWT